MTELVIIRGLPGSGKSTYAEEKYPDHVLFEPDHLISGINRGYFYHHELFNKAHDFLESLVNVALSHKENVVVCDIFPKSESLDSYIELAKYYKCKIIIKTLTENFGSIHNVPKFQIDEMEFDLFNRTMDFSNE